MNTALPMAPMAQSWPAISAAGPENAYTPEGYQQHHLRTFLRPLEQTANLCKMHFLPPYVLYGSLKAAKDGAITPHAAGYRRLLEGLRDDRFDSLSADAQQVLTHDTLPHQTKA